MDAKGGKERPKSPKFTTSRLKTGSLISVVVILVALVYKRTSDQELKVLPRHKFDQPKYDFAVSCSCCNKN